MTNIEVTVPVKGSGVRAVDRRVEAVALVVAIVVEGMGIRVTSGEG